MRRAFVGIILLFFLLESNASRYKKIGCEDHKEVSGHLVPLPWGLQAKFTRPWLRTDLEAKLFESKPVSFDWLWMKNLKVRGLNATLEEFMAILELNKCLFIPYGEAVKDLLLGTVRTTSILKLEGESTCSIKKVYELCTKAYGLQSCGTEPTEPYHRVTVGRMNDRDMLTTTMVDPIVIGEWNSTFKRPKHQWEFTANTVGLFDNMAGMDYIIDLSGRSVEDICDRRIVLPVALDDFDKWAGDDLSKVMRYFNLKAESFVPADQVEEHIIKKVQAIYTSSKFQEYYCRFVYDGVFVPYDPYSISDLNSVEGNSPQCRIVSQDSRRERMIGSVNATLKEKFGRFWQSRMFPDLQSLKFVKLDDSVFLAKASGQAPWLPHETTTERVQEVPVSGDDQVTKDAAEEEEVIIEYVDCPSAASTLYISIFITIFCAIIFNI